MRVITQAANQHLLIILESGLGHEKSLAWKTSGPTGRFVSAMVLPPIRELQGIGFMDDCPQLSGVALPRVRPKTM
jgi:hypothetical protein